MVQPKRLSKFGPNPMGLGTHRFFVQLFAEDEEKVLDESASTGEAAAAIIRRRINRSYKGGANG